MVDFDSIWPSVQQIYADVGHTAGSDEANDLRNRIRDGQTADAIIANTYDDAQRRFKANGHDAQLNTGIEFDTPQVMLTELARPAREVATVSGGASLPAVSPQFTNPTAMRSNAGPAPTLAGGGSSFLGGISMGSLLLIGGGIIAAIVLFQYLGKHHK